MNAQNKPPRTLNALLAELAANGWHLAEAPQVFDSMQTGRPVIDAKYVRIVDGAALCYLKVRVFTAIGNRRTWKDAERIEEEYLPVFGAAVYSKDTVFPPAPATIGAVVDPTGSAS